MFDPYETNTNPGYKITIRGKTSYVRNLPDTITELETLLLSGTEEPITIQIFNYEHDKQ